MPRGIRRDGGASPLKGRVSPIKGTRRVTYSTCKHCSKEFNKGRPQLYCSLSCSIESGYRGKQISFAKGNKTGWVTSINQRIRGSNEYKKWRKAVFERDDYTCQECNARGVELNADHIKEFAYYPELRFELSNGRTLCVPCHKKTESYLSNRFRNKLGQYTTIEKYLGENT